MARAVRQLMCFFGGHQSKVELRCISFWMLAGSCANWTGFVNLGTGGPFRCSFQSSVEQSDDGEQVFQEATLFHSVCHSCEAGGHDA